MDKITHLLCELHDPHMRYNRKLPWIECYTDTRPCGGVYTIQTSLDEKFVIRVGESKNIFTRALQHVLLFNQLAVEIRKPKCIYEEALVDLIAHKGHLIITRAIECEYSQTKEMERLITHKHWSKGSRPLNGEIYNNQRSTKAWNNANRTLLTLIKSPLQLEFDFPF